jgi:hypothetical protein
MRFIILPILLVIFNLNIINSEKVTELTDSNFEQLVNYGRDNKWLLVFYLGTCPHCTSAKKVISKYSESLKDDSLKIGYMECNNNLFTCLRFNVTKVPLILLAENEKIVEYQEYPSETSIRKFVTSEKLNDTASNFPVSFGYIELVFKIMQETVLTLNDTMKRFLKEKIGINIDWGSNHTAGLLLAILILIFFIEYLIVAMFFGKSKEEVAEVKTENNKEAINENDKKEITTNDTKKVEEKELDKIEKKNQ